MPTTINRGTPVASRPVSSQPRSLTVKVMENDPALQAEVRNSKLVVLRGVASNRGIVRSFVKLEFDGKSVNVPLSGGETAKRIMDQLSRALPPGYELIVPVTAGRTGNDLAQFEIRKVRSNVSEINAQFAKAQKAASESGKKVSIKELRAAVAIAEKGGLSVEDRDALARNWASLFTGAGYQATPAAQREYAKLQQRLDLPVYPVR